WPIYFYITQGEIIKPKESISIPLVSALLPIQRYDLPYDVSYPVMVSIRAPDALRGKGYSFVFALESNVRNNEPITGETAEAKISLDLSADAAYCEEKQLNSADVTFRVADLLGRPIPDASVTFSAQDTGCLIGFTELDGDRAVFTGKFPKGAIGSIIIEHPDYEKYVKLYFRGKDEPQDLGVINMKGYVIKNVTAKRVDIDKVPYNPVLGGGGWQFIPLKHTLRGNEKVVVMLERIKETPYDDEVFTAAELTQTTQAEMRLVPGKYNLKVVILQQGVTVVIPKEEVEVDDEDETIPETVLANNADFMAGQYETEIIIDNGIYYDNTIEFTAVAFNLIGTPTNERVHDDLNVWSKVDQIANNHAEYLQPVLIAEASP
ncbi:MAG: hypothetical protein KKE20_06065, partial [Nanoarchaeota archaeon]|nr:hypothetical protein [Nanoarchaeota archaeon]